MNHRRHILTDKEEAQNNTFKITKKISRIKGKKHEHLTDRENKNQLLPVGRGSLEGGD